MNDLKIKVYEGDISVLAGMAELDKTPLPSAYLSLVTPRGTWVGDVNFGSRLHLLVREKALPRVEQTAVEYCNEAMAWMLERPEIDDIQVTASLENSPRRLICHVTIYWRGEELTFKHFVEV